LLWGFNSFNFFWIHWGRSQQLPVKIPKPHDVIMLVHNIMMMMMIIIIIRFIDVTEHDQVVSSLSHPS